MLIPCGHSSSDSLIKEQPVRANAPNITMIVFILNCMSVFFYVNDSGGTRLISLKGSPRN